MAKIAYPSVYFTKATSQRWGVYVWGYESSVTNPKQKRI